MKTTNKNLGNPAAAAAAVEIAKNPTFQKGVKIVGGGLLLVGGGLLARRFYKIQKSKKTIRKGTKAVQQAIKLRSAMKSWGGGTFPHQSSILSSFIFGSAGFTIPDGTDEGAIGKVAAEITNWPLVQKEYNAIFWTELLGDLQSELSAEELNSFFAILNREETRDQEIKKTPHGHYSAGEVIYALNNRTKSYDEPALKNVMESYDAGEEIGEIKEVAKLKDGTILYRLREFFIPGDSWLGVPGLYYIWLRHDDVTNDPDIDGLSGIDSQKLLA